MFAVFRARQPGLLEGATQAVLSVYTLQRTDKSAKRGVYLYFGSLWEPSRRLEVSGLVAAGENGKGGGG